ncbi:hypothetical protein, partial [Kitasatospora sp. NPDC059599]|uniref:hypothetical protein n=1 Tax=Kitasatospora sp. NPDC059599 TaxID=3346880 RepID=UPI003684287E
TLLSSQGTDASFGLPSSRPSGLRSFVFPAYQTFSAPFSGVSFIRFSELVGPLSATSTTLAHSESYSKFTPTPIDENANEPN